MRIVLVASEVAPFATTGGRADVVGALPKSIERAGHDVSVVAPCYRCVRQGGFETLDTGVEIRVPVGWETLSARVLQAHLPGSNVRVFFLEYDPYYDREELYTTFDGDYPDNAQRFILLARGTLEFIKTLGERVDVIHGHDWQTALLPVYLEQMYRDAPALARTGTLFTVHNLSFQGLFPAETAAVTNLPDELFAPDKMGFYGRINFMKGALLFADVINTVSKKYAQESGRRNSDAGWKTS